MDPLQEHLNRFATAIAGDGYAFEVYEVNRGVAKVRVVALNDACEDCLIPAADLEAILFHKLREADPRLRSVKVDMP